MGADPGKLRGPHSQDLASRSNMLANRRSDAARMEGWLGRGSRHFYGSWSNYFSDCRQQLHQRKAIPEAVLEG